MATINKTEYATAVKFIHTSYLTGFLPDPQTMELIHPLIYNILDLNDIDAVEVASLAAADLMLMIDNHSHQRSDDIREFIRRASTTVKGGRTNQGKS